MPVQRMYVIWCDDEDCQEFHVPEGGHPGEVGLARKLAKADGWKVPSNTKMSDQTIWCPNHWHRHLVARQTPVTGM